jgi:hypothetical protein
MEVHMETESNQPKELEPQAFLVRLQLHHKYVDRVGDLYVLIRRPSELEEVVENLDFDVRVLLTEIVALDSNYGPIEVGRFLA